MLRHGAGLGEWPIHVPVCGEIVDKEGIRTSP